MKEMQGKKIDEFFRKGLSEPDIPFQEGHWIALKAKLEEQEKRKKGIVWWTRAGGVAATLLLGFLVWNSQNDAIISKNLKIVKTRPVVTGQSSPSPGEIVSGNGLPVSEQPELFHPAPEKGIIYHRGFNQRLLPVNLPDDAIPAVANVISEVYPSPVQQPVITMPPAAPSVQSETTGNNEARSIVKNSPEPPGNIKSGSQFPERLALTATPGINSLKPGNIGSDFKPSLTLGFFVSPDINGVNNLETGRVGVNAGLLAAVKVSPRFSISTGITYAKKIYRTDFSNYNPNSNYKFPVTPESVSADCRVLDVPLNINYTVWNNNNNAIQLVAGASSYFMLQEKYSYSYEDPTAASPDSYEVKKKNKHYLGIVNLAFNYERKLNNKISVGVQPYLKLPVTDIGYGNVRLESAGMALNFNLNLFSKDKDQ